MQSLPAPARRHVGYAPLVGKHFRFRNRSLWDAHVSESTSRSVCLSLVTALLLGLGLLTRLAVRDWPRFLITVYYLGMVASVVVGGAIVVLLARSRDLEWVGAVEQTYRSLFAYQFSRMGAFKKARAILSSVIGLVCVVLTWPGYAVGLTVRYWRYRGRLNIPFSLGLSALGTEDTTPDRAHADSISK